MAINSTTQAQKESGIQWSGLHKDPLYKIFSYMDVQDLVRCAQVCKRWRTVADNEGLWAAIARSRVLGKKVWEDNVGAVGDEPEYRMVPFNGMNGEQIPWKEVCKMHKKPSSFWENKKFFFFWEKVWMIKMPEFDFLVPATINGLPTTINNVIKVFRKAKLPISSKVSSPVILEVYGDIAVEKSYFARHTWTVVNDTLNITPDEKLAIVQQSGKGLYRLPYMIEIMIFQFLCYQAGIENGFGCKESMGSQCFEKININGKICPIIAADFHLPCPDNNPNNALFDIGYINTDNHKRGAGAVREL